MAGRPAWQNHIREEQGEGKERLLRNLIKRARPGRFGLKRCKSDEAMCAALPYDGMIRVRFQGSGRVPPLSLAAPPAKNTSGSFNRRRYPDAG